MNNDEPAWLLRARLMAAEPDFPELCILVVGLVAIIVVQVLT